MGNEINLHGLRFDCQCLSALAAMTTQCLHKFKMVKVEIVSFFAVSLGIF